MEDFQDCLADCGLVDMGYTGYPYTWDNKREGDQNIQCRLDRATCNDKYMQVYAETTIEHILTEESDHVALLVRAKDTLVAEAAKSRAGFRYEQMWSKHDGYSDMVEAAWRDASSDQNRLKGMCHRLKKTTRYMQQWGATVFGSVRRQLAQLKRH